jgi:hypothetical protein
VVHSESRNARITTLPRNCDGVADALVGGAVLAVDAAGVNLEQDSNAVGGIISAAGRGYGPGLVHTVELSARFSQRARAADLRLARELSSRPSPGPGRGPLIGVRKKPLTWEPPYGIEP